MGEYTVEWAYPNGSLPSDAMNHIKPPDFMVR